MAEKSTAGAGETGTEKPDIDDESREENPEADAFEGVQETDDASEGVQDEADAGESGPQKGADEAFCSSCGEVIKKEAEICPHCGVSQDASEAGDKNPGLAAVIALASQFVPIAAGAGQIYNGQIGKGIAICVVQAINAALMLFLVGFLTYPLVSIYAIYDAYSTAKKIDQGEISV